MRTSRIRTGNGVTTATCKSKGPAKFYLKDSEGTLHEIIRDVIFVPGFHVNLFSPQADLAKNGTRIEFNNNPKITIDGKTIPFACVDGSYLLGYKIIEI